MKWKQERTLKMTLKYDYENVVGGSRPLIFLQQLESLDKFKKKSMFVKTGEL